MKKLITIFLIISVCAMSASAYEFLGPKWPGKNPVVPYWFNEKGCEDVIDEWEYLHQAFNVWCDVPTTAIDCEYKGMTANEKVAPDGEHMLKWAKGKDWPLGGNVVAVCYVWSNNVNSITDYDIVFNNKNWAWSTTGQSGRMDVGHIATHEVGHALGMDHSEYPEAVMWHKVKQGDISNRKLHPDDSAGITALYPRTNTNNRAPIITSTPVTQAIAGMKYNYQVTAMDPDSDAIKFSLRIKPLNMRIDSITGLITWFPKFLDLKEHDVIVVATDELGASTEQRYRLNVTNLVVYTVDDTVAMGDTLYYKVYVTPMDEYGVLAGNIELTYDKNKMVILEIDTIGTVLTGASYAKNISDNMIKFAFAGADPLSGGGVLFRIKMQIFDEYCGQVLQTPIVKAFFNDGDPVATTSDGTIFMPCGGDGYQVDGKVLYFANRMGVGGAELELLEIGQKVTSNDDGYFAFSHVPHSWEQYTIFSEKDSGDIRDAVTAYDASLILRYVVDLHDLNTYEYQRETADVNSNEMLTAYDAALILRFIVEYNDATNIGKWVMVPEETILKELLEPEHNLEINAYMIGDVSGNWNEWTREPKRGATSIATVLMGQFEPCSIATDEGARMGYRATISIKDIMNDIFSGQFELTFNNTKYKLHNVRPAALLNGYLSLDNAVDNRILVAFAGTEPLAMGGELYQIEVLPVGDYIPGDTAINSSKITSCLVNEVKDNPVEIGENQQIVPTQTATRITSVYPNPFIHNVSIQYSVSAKQNVRIGIYDLRGRELRTLVNSKKTAGTYKATWDGKNASGTDMSAQIYIIRFMSKEHSKNFKIYKIR